MFTFAKKMGTTVLGGVIAWNLVASFASAQPVPHIIGDPPTRLTIPGLPTVGKFSGDISTLGDALGHWPGLRPGEMPTTSTSNENLNHNFTNFDVAEVLRAISEDQINYQTARLKGQDVWTAKLKNQRQWLYNYLERLSLMPTREDFRDRQRKEDLRHSLNLPLDEAPSAFTLNTLLHDLQKLQVLQVRGPRIPVDPKVLSAITFTPGNRSGSIEVLKNGSALPWPMVLQGSEFQTQRELFGSLIPAAVGRAGKGQVDAAVIEEMSGAVQSLRFQLKAKIKDIPGPHYIQARSFLDRLDEDLKVLRQPDVAYYFNGRYSPQGRTVAELIQDMTAKGLKFGTPADDQAAYLALHQALVAYDVGSNQKVKQPPAKKVTMRPSALASE